MTSKSQSTVWIKSPMAIFAENAEEGIVVQDEKILELVARGQKPKNQIDEVYDAGDIFHGLRVFIRCGQTFSLK